MHTLFSPEEASGVREFGMAFDRFKHVNRLCERYFPVSSFFPLSDGYALILCSKPMTVVFYSHSAQMTAFTDIRMPNSMPQRCFTLFCFLLFLSFSSITLRICSKRSSFAHFSTRRSQIPCGHGRVVHRRLNSVGKSSGARQVSKTDDHSWQLLLFPSWTRSLVP